MASSTAVVLRERSFRAQLIANFVSSVGLWVHTAAAAWVMLEMTGSPGMVGLLASSSFLPRIFLSVPAGAVVDAVDIRRIILWANLFQLAVAGAMALGYALDVLGPPQLIAATLLLGVGQSLSIPAYQSMLPDLVPRELAGAAISVHIGSVNVARGIGPAVGGAFVAIGRADLAFLTNACTYLAVCLATRLLPELPRRAEQREPVASAIKMGVRFVRHSPVLVRVMAIAALFGLTASNLQTLLAPMADEPLGLGARGYGALYGCFGLGAVAGAALSDRLVRLARAQAVQTPAMMTFGLAGVAFAVLRHPALSAVAIAVAGAAWLVTVSALNATVQLSSPRWVRGRALSLYFFAFTGSLPVGSALAGWLAELHGTPVAVGVLSGASVLVGGLSYLSRTPPLATIIAATEDEVPAAADAPSPPVAGPVAVLTRWHVDSEHLDAALAAAGRLRKARYRAGAIRWQLFQDPDDPRRLTEIVELATWADHLRQADRLDRSGRDALAAVEAVALRIDPPTSLVAAAIPDP